jgi:hypothetical protein
MDLTFFQSSILFWLTPPYHYWGSERTHFYFLLEFYIESEQQSVSVVQQALIRFGWGLLWGLMMMTGSMCDLCFLQSIKLCWLWERKNIASLLSFSILIHSWDYYTDNSSIWMHIFKGTSSSSQAFCIIITMGMRTVIFYYLDYGYNNSKYILLYMGGWS